MGQRVKVGGRGKPRVHVITMGCAKNTVDSEKLLAQLRVNRIPIAESIDHADVAVINTCGFIDAAKEESIDMIIANVRRKGKGRLRKVLAMGCLTERYRVDLERDIPEVDRFFGTHQLADVIEELGGHLRKELLGERYLTTPSHTAYLKISEGCDHPCSFCAIPQMRGAHVSRPMKEILDEARILGERGVKELIVIGQDTTFYGWDRWGERRLARLLEQLASVKGIEWVRLMYAYPAHFPMDVLNVMAGSDRICKYIDMPVQHASDAVLKSMRRGMTARALRELIEKIRKRIPHIALRSTLIVGYPTEGEREFEELLSFVRETRFERLGVFTYSQEEGTSAHPLGDPVPADEKERRRGAVMEAQREISEARNEALIGSTLRVLIDREEEGMLYGRTEMDAPEIDNEVVLPADPAIAVGSFCTVGIVDAYEYDLIGRGIS
ncbi:MAG: 30S ribosomal protein S12 methylthiotransferase RimO [Bacteroidetes bacterium]|nr:30S ribosomal protein S12 methylthiotransferase RimO [Bacteroidota bacterium]